METIPENDSLSAVAGVDAPVLTPVVRRVLGSESAQITRWQVEPLGGGAGNPVSVGLFRFSGTAQADGGQVAWSAVLKIIQSPENEGWEAMGAGDDQGHWNYWKRELYLYPSGLLDSLPDGLAAPRCYGTAERPGNIAWIWLEDIAGETGEEWSLERYVLAARHLGRLNGAYAAGRPLPVHPWLNRHGTRQWVDQNMLWNNLAWEHAVFLARYPDPTTNPLRRLLDDHGRVFARLEELPRVFGHGDTYPTNMKSRLAGGRQQETVLLDWALSGIAPLGDDLGQLAYGATMNVKGLPRAEIDRAVFAGYLDGLRDSGSRFDPRLVRFAYAASAAFRVGIWQLILLNWEIQKAQADEAYVPYTAQITDPFEVALAQEASQLLGGL